jgi:RNA polymerase sigma-70 factor (ECF subfamily)
MQKREKNIQVLAENFLEGKDEKTFTNLFERLKPGIMNHCYVILGDREQAEDAFINTMTKIWTKIDQYDNERANFSTWCYNIARNESLLLIKSRNRYVSQNDQELDYSSNKSSNAQGAYSMEDSQDYAFKEENSIEEIYDSVIDEIRDLPELYRDIMIDREINGMKYKDIAEKYGIKKRSIATRIRRARAKIKKKMKKHSPKQ